LNHESVHENVMAARAEGRPEEALELLRMALEGDPHDPDLTQAFFETAVDLGRVEEGVAVLAPTLWREVEEGERETAVSHWLALCGAGASVSGESPLLLRLAGWLRDAKHRDAASVALRCVFNACPGDPAVAMRVARLARSIDPALALEAAEVALQAPGLETAEREALEAILSEADERVDDRSIPLALPGASEPPPDAAEELDRGALEPAAISDDPEPGMPEAGSVLGPDLGGNVLDLSEKEDPEVPALGACRTLRVLPAVPRRLDEEAIYLEVESKGPTRLPFSRVDAVSAAGVHGLSRKAVILIDLVLDWHADAEKPLTVLRLRSDRYDPRALVGNPGSPLQATAQLVSTLITQARALALPDPGSARGEPFRIFRDLASYEEQVLRAERPPVDDIF
jgi:hypothetical protein